MTSASAAFIAKLGRDFVYELWIALLFKSGRPPPYAPKKGKGSNCSTALLFLVVVVASLCELRSLISDSMVLRRRDTIIETSSSFLSFIAYFAALSASSFSISNSY